jgi:hypothetical protein
MARLESIIASALLLTLSAGSAQATLYTGARSFGFGPFKWTLTIETDGTLGVLEAENILRFNVRLSGLDADDVANYGKNPEIDAFFGNPLVVRGTSLTATRQKVFFDFDKGGGYFGVVNNPYYLLTAADCTLCRPSREFLELDPQFGFFIGQSGNQVLASVPEPASWVTLIAGFGLVGAALRRRKAVTTAA